MKAEITVMTGGEPGVLLSCENQAELYILQLVTRDEVLVLNRGGNTREGRYSAMIAAKEQCEPAPATDSRLGRFGEFRSLLIGACSIVRCLDRNGHYADTKQFLARAENLICQTE